MRRSDCRSIVRLGSPVALATLCGLAFAASADAQTAVTVVGGGLARDCYEAVENRSQPPARALRLCDLALEQEILSPKDRAATRINRGILHMREGRNDRALNDFEAGLRIDTDLAEAKVNLGAALYNLGRYSEALSALNDGVTAATSSARATAHYNRALTFEKLGDVRAAYDDHHKALAIWPEFEPPARQLERFRVVRADQY